MICSSLSADREAVDNDKSVWAFNILNYNFDTSFSKAAEPLNLDIVELIQEVRELFDSML